MKKLALILFMGTLVSFYADADNEQTHHQRVVLHSLSPCRMAGKRLRSELLGSFVGLG
ncbi:hypothetical protein ABJ945_001908 [Escherichia coli]